MDLNIVYLHENKGITFFFILFVFSDLKNPSGAGSGANITATTAIPESVSAGVSVGSC